MRQEVKEAMEKAGVSQNKMAKTLGVSPAFLSNSLNGGRGDDEKKLWEEKILKSLEEMTKIEETSPAEKIDFRPRGQAELGGFLERIYQQRSFGLATGHSGVGKTFTIQRFLERHSDILVLDSDPGMSFGGIWDELLRLSGCEMTGLRSATMKRRHFIRQCLETGIRMIVVDEADELFSYTSTPSAVAKKMDLFRKINDDGLGVALVGLPDFEKKVNISIPAHVRSRIGLKHALPFPAQQELADFAKMKKIPAETKHIRAARNKGNFRYLERIGETLRDFGAAGEAFLY